MATGRLVSQVDRSHVDVLEAVHLLRRRPVVGLQHLVELLFQGMQYLNAVDSGNANSTMRRPILTPRLLGLYITGVCPYACNNRRTHR